MELVRYRPGEAIKWLQTGAENMRKTATVRSKGIVRQTGVDQKGFGENVKTAAGAIFDYGKSAYADVMHRQAEASEYVLQDDHFEIVRNGSIKSVPYSQVRQVLLEPDRAKLVLEKGIITIKPFAHIVAGRLKVPVGWSRNGMEVPFDLIVQELAARCSLEVEEE
ncbi:MAG TPA: hypothetical protein VG944_12480 [Fimbriimonas sp.]|nr:hypothetical protein [Fimbriimonas sp.]